MQRVRAIVRHEVVIDALKREFSIGDSVAVPADYGAKVWRVGEVVAEVVVPKHHIGESSIFVGHQQRNDNSAIVGDFGFKPI